MNKSELETLVGKDEEKARQLLEKFVKQVKIELSWATEL
jgi:hypothetical protein